MGILVAAPASALARWVLRNVTDESAVGLAEQVLRTLPRPAKVTPLHGVYEDTLRAMVDAAVYGRVEITTAEVISACLLSEGRSSEMRVAACLRRLGFDRRRSSGAGRCWLWVRP